MAKRRLLLVAILLIGCAVAAVIGGMRPVETSTQVILANYSHRGQFSYTAYSISKADDTGPASTLYPKIIDTMEMLFACSSNKSDEVKMKAVLEDKNAGWLKEIPIQVSGGPVFSFPLDVNGILKLGNTINTELGGRGGTYLLRIEAAVGSRDQPMTAVLEGDLSASALVWQEDGFQKVELGFPGGNTLRWAAFGFRAKLTENSLFGPTSLERIPSAPKILPIGPDEPPVTSNVEYVDIGLGYQLVADTPVRSLTAEVEVDLTVAESGGWSKTYIVAGPLDKDGPFNLSIPLDIGRLVEMADSNDVLVGSRAAQDRQITIAAQVRTHARTDVGVIDEVFRQQLTGKMGKVITWEAADKGGSSLLTLVKAGKITTTTTKIDNSARVITFSSLILLAFSAGLFVFLLPAYLRLKSKTSLMGGLKSNRKKYGELISEVSDFPMNGRGGPVTAVPSLESLVKISNNSLKPILLKIEDDRHSYRVMDGWVTYEYVSSAGSVVEAPQTEPGPSKA